MATRVLIPIDGSDQSEEALEHAIREYPDAELIVLHVIDVVSGLYVDGYLDYRETRENQEKRAEALLSDTADLAKSHGRDVTTETVVGQPATSIVEAAEDMDADLIVIGSHGRSGVSRILLGSVAETVIRRAPVPVTVVR